jgi:hypothetical protein
MSFPILSTMIALPLLAAAGCLFLKANGARWLALGATLACSSSDASCGQATTSAARNGSSRSVSASARLTSTGRSASTASR